MAEETKQPIEEITENAPQSQTKEAPVEKLNEFEKTIKSYLDKRATEDELFAKSYSKDGMSIKECCNFIIQEVRKSGRCGFADEEIFGLAVHYYDKDDLGEIKSSSAKVVVNHEIQLTEEEKAAAKARALAKFEADEKRRLERAAGVPSEPAPKAKPKPKEKKTPVQESTVPSLFDFGMEDEE